MKNAQHIVAIEEQIKSLCERLKKNYCCDNVQFKMYVGSFVKKYFDENPLQLTEYNIEIVHDKTITEWIDDNGHYSDIWIECTECQ